MKKLISAVLMVTLLFALFTLVGCKKEKQEASETTTGIVYDVKKDSDGKKYAIVKKYSLSTDDAEKVSKGSYSDLMVDIVINDYDDDNNAETPAIPVKEISAGAFTNQLVIKKLTVGENVEKIGMGALAGCANLNELVLNFVGETVDAKNEKKTLGYLFGTSSFTGGVAISMVYAQGSTPTTYYIPATLNKVTVTGATLSDYAFNKTAIETVELSGNIEYIGEGAFSGMTKLATIKLPSSVTEIGKFAFKDTTSLYNVDFSVATNLTTIYQEAFSGCTMLGYGKYEVKLPASLEKLYEGAFSLCTSLKTIDLTQTKITEIPTACFYGCKNLESINYKTDTVVGNDAIPEKLLDK